MTDLEVAAEYQFSMAIAPAQTRRFVSAEIENEPPMVARLHSELYKCCFSGSSRGAKALRYTCEHP